MEQIQTLAAVNLNSLIPKPTQNLEVSSRVSRRAEVFGDFVNSFVALSKKKFENDKERTAWYGANAVILARLHELDYTSEQWFIAMQWIHRGDPMRYKDFTFQDFFPTEEQLESINYDLLGLMQREYNRGFREGYSIGWNEGFDGTPRRNT